jgi:hypothetical protein
MCLVTPTGRRVNLVIVPRARVIGVFEHHCALSRWTGADLVYWIGCSGLTTDFFPFASSLHDTIPGTPSLVEQRSSRAMDQAGVKMTVAAAYAVCRLLSMRLVGDPDSTRYRDYIEQQRIKRGTALQTPNVRC